MTCFHRLVHEQHIKAFYQLVRNKQNFFSNSAAQEFPRISEKNLVTLLKSASCPPAITSKLCYASHLCSFQHLLSATESLPVLHATFLEKAKEHNARLAFGIFVEKLLPTVLCVMCFLEYYSKFLLIKFENLQTIWMVFLDALFAKVAKEMALPLPNLATFSSKETLMDYLSDLLGLLNKSEKEISRLCKDLAPKILFLGPCVSFQEIETAPAPKNNTEVNVNDVTRWLHYGSRIFKTQSRALSLIWECIAVRGEQDFGWHNISTGETSDDSVVSTILYEDCASGILYKDAILVASDENREETTTEKKETENKNKPKFVLLQWNTEDDIKNQSVEDIIYFATAMK